MKSIIITQQDIEKNISLKEIVNTVDEIYHLYGKGDIIMPTKVTLNMESLGLPNWFISMPAYIKSLDTAGIKFIGGFNSNKKIGLPYIMSQMLLNDPKTGELKALLDGNLITFMRTGAQSPVFAKYLASKSDILTIVGAGVQGTYSALCMLEIFDFKEIRVFDLSKEACDNFINNVGHKTTTPIVAHYAVKDAISDADIIVTATTSNKPFISKGWVKPGAFISCIGSNQELDDELILCADKRYVDHMEQNIHRGEFADCFKRGILKNDDIVGEVGDLVCGNIVGRENDSEIIIASPIGMGCLDIGVATAIYNKIITNKNEKMIEFKIQ